MSKNRLVLSDAAAADIIEQADWYETQSGRTLVRRWEDAVTSALTSVLRRPLTGTPCHFKTPELEGLRRVAIPGFPKHLLFYKADSGIVIVVRVFHGARDLDSLL